MLKTRWILLLVLVSFVCSLAYAGGDKKGKKQKVNPVEACEREIQKLETALDDEEDEGKREALEKQLNQAKKKFEGVARTRLATLVKQVKKLERQVEGAEDEKREKLEEKLDGMRDEIADLRDMLGEGEEKKKKNEAFGDGEQGGGGGFEEEEVDIDVEE